LKGYNWENGKYCADLVALEAMSGSTNKCIGGLRFGGAGYNFRGKKRDAKPQECMSSQKATVLTLENGNRYMIADMQEGLVDELFAHAANGTAAKDIPEMYKRFVYQN
jgi:hypothetical protein